MKLSEYLETNKMSQTEFCRLSGVNISTISRICSGKRKPNDDAMRKIFWATNKQVTPDDFYELSEIQPES